MIAPERAPVRPRVKRTGGGSAFLLEVEIAELAQQGRRGVVLLGGGPGCGKTTALKHLAAVLPASLAVRLLDPEQSDIRSAWTAPLLAEHTLVVTTMALAERKADVELELASWGRDEWIEFLLARYPQCCKSVMSRLLSNEENLGAGYPAEVWSVVLEEMAADETIGSPLDALICRLSRSFTRDEQLALSRLAIDCLRTTQVISWEDACNEVSGIERRVWRLLNQPLVIDWISAAFAVWLLKNGTPADVVRCLGRIRQLPRSYLRFVAFLTRGDEVAASQLYDIARSRAFDCHAAAVSVLHLAGALPSPSPGSRPIADAPQEEPFPGPRLACGCYEEAVWPGVLLSRMDLSGANFTLADLRQARLEQVAAGGADFSHADLRGASLERANLARAHLVSAYLTGTLARKANFQGADCRQACFTHAVLDDVQFVHADLTGCSFFEARLEGASLCGAMIDRADFRRADLRRARLDRLSLVGAEFAGALFNDASLVNCTLEGMQLEAPQFAGANLAGATFTGASMPRANFREANLRGCGLADVDWEGADLRDADLRGAVFSMGGSRSGLVGSPYPSHGTRTGFYTDDLSDLSTHKHPEEIRKANLCGADLRGANIAGVDFYLVDLRGALYDDRQAERLRCCGAILKEPVT
jgi:uncharacterized protein YjbI with pentapeptide repeats